MSLSFSDIRKILPHRFPVALVDRVLELVPNKSLRAIKCVTANEPCFATVGEDASGDAYVYPQSLMIESFLQAAGIFLIASMDAPQTAQKMVLLFGSLSDCVFHDCAQPGKGHHSRHETTRRAGRYCNAQGSTSPHIP